MLCFSSSRYILSLSAIHCSHSILLSSPSNPHSGAHLSHRPFSRTGPSHEFTSPRVEPCILHTLSSSAFLSESRDVSVSGISGSHSRSTDLRTDSVAALRIRESVLHVRFSLHHFQHTSFCLSARSSRSVIAACLLRIAGPLRAGFADVFPGHVFFLPFSFCTSRKAPNTGVRNARGVLSSPGQRFGRVVSRQRTSPPPFEIDPGLTR